MGRKLQLAIVIFDGVSALEVVAPYECLKLLPNVEVIFVSHEVGAVKDDLGYLSLGVTHTFAQVPRPDIVIVPGGTEIKRRLKDEAFLLWLRQVHETTIYTASVGSGSLMLAAAGLLVEGSYATHWICQDELKNLGASFVEGRVVQEGKIITAAGPSSAIEMGLKIASLVTNDSLAKSVQLIIEFDPRPPFDCGSSSKADGAIVDRARALAYASELRCQSL